MRKRTVPDMVSSCQRTNHNWLICPYLVAVMRTRYALGFGLAAGAAVLWIVAVVAGSPDALTIVSLATILVGFLTAAEGERGGRVALIPVGLLAVAVGIILFYRGDLWSSIYNVAGLLFATGAAVAAAGASRDSVLPQQLGFAAAALASLLWLYADLGSWWWQPGNVLMVAACATAASGADQPQRP